MTDARATSTFRWQYTPWGDLRFDATGHLVDGVPSEPPVTSVRAVVLHANRALLCQTPDGPHVWPGGRQEDGESPAATVAREVTEETGWDVRSAPSSGTCICGTCNPSPTVIRSRIPTSVSWSTSRMP